jgi:hypothetical protein
VTVTRSVAFPVALLALALGCPGATLDLDGASFLDRPYGDDDGVEGCAGGGHLFDQAGNAHRQHPLARIRMSPSRQWKSAHLCKGFSPERCRPFIRDEGWRAPKRRVSLVVSGALDRMWPPIGTARRV